MALEFPALDPVAFQIGPLAVRWYALAYVTGILLGWRYCLYLIRSATQGEGRLTQAPTRVRLPDASDLEECVTYAIIGILMGGRIGYVSFYNWGYYSQNIDEILYLWQGGMSFHGGMLGVFLSMIILSKIRGIDFLRLSDVVTAAAPIGLFFGRIANFMNAELYGRATDLPWAVKFPTGGEVGRHPSQLYEAVLEGLVLFAILLWCQRYPPVRNRLGVTSGVFLSAYGVFRYAVESVREPDAHLGLFSFGLSMGQVLSLPMILCGALVIVWRFQTKESAL